MTSFLKFWACDAARPLLRVLPRGSIRLLTWLGGGDQTDLDWLHNPRRIRVQYDSAIGAHVVCDLADWGGRWYYYPGRYYDLANQLLIGHVLKPGGTFVDVGANLGVHSLLASSIVGVDGRVYSFEPNATTFELLKAHIAINRKENVQLFRLGLSDSCGAASLASVGPHSGTSTLRHVEQADISQVVEISTGDEALKGCKISNPLLLKIDVEGFEGRVLAGMSEFLQRYQPIVTMEISPQWLSQEGTNAEQITHLMAAHGYSPFLPTVNWTAGVFPRLKLCAGPYPPGQHDIVFATPGHLARLPLC